MGKRGPRIHEFRHDAPYGGFFGPPGMLTGQGRYHLGIPTSSSQTEFVNANTGRLYASPIAVPRAINVQGLACWVNTAQAASNVRLGLYKAQEDGTPGVLVADSGNIDSSTTGNKEATVDVALTPGWYWGAWEYDTASVGLRGRGVGAAYDLGAVNAYNSPHTSLHTTHTFGALPDPYGTITSFATDSGGVVYLVVT